jgi:hypothetical protein
MFRYEKGEWQTKKMIYDFPIQVNFYYLMIDSEEKKEV